MASFRKLRDPLFGAFSRYLLGSLNCPQFSRIAAHFQGSSAPSAAARGRGAATPSGPGPFRRAPWVLVAGGEVIYCTGTSMNNIEILVKRKIRFPFCHLQRAIRRSACKKAAASRRPYDSQTQKEEAVVHTEFPYRTGRGPPRAFLSLHKLHPAATSPRSSRSSPQSWKNNGGT